MSGRRPVLPVVALVLVLAALVGVRLWSDAGSDGGSTASSGDRASGATTTTASPGRAHTGGIRFTDVTKRAGLDQPQSTAGLFGEAAMTSGAAVADVNGDGRPDLYLTRVGVPNALYLNDGRGHFTDVAAASGVTGPDPSQGSGAAAFADVDADGDPDLYVTGAGTNANVLYLNDGSGHFRDATAGSGLDDLPAVAPGGSAQMHGATFADVDRDGHLDLLVTHWDNVVPSALADPAANGITPDAAGSLVCARADYLRRAGFPRPAGSAPNRARLYRNDGTGHFRDVSAALGVPNDQVLGFTGTFADVDGDGWDDLLLTGDFCTSRLLHNDGGRRFIDVTAQSGVGTDENGMGSVVRDVNGDGHPDWFVTGIGPTDGDGSGGAAEEQLGSSYGRSGNRLYLNRGDGTFTDATEASGLRNGGWAWGAAIEDFGNDGRLGVAVTNGYEIGADGVADPGPVGGRQRTAVDPMRFWVPVRSSHLEASGAVGLTDTGIGHALVAFDMDGDGDQDLLVAHAGTAPTLYRNDSPRRHHLDIRLEDPTTPGNRQGLGARVAVTPTGGAAPVVQWVQTGGSYESQRPAEVHVGLGRTDTAARVEVLWPGSTVPQVLTDVPADQVLVVRRAGPS